MRVGYSFDHLMRHFQGDYDKAFTAIKKAGITAVDYYDYLGNTGKLSAAEEDRYCKEVLDACKKYDVEISQAHAPYLFWRTEEQFMSEEFFKRVVASIERASHLGVKYLVVHPFDPEGIDFFRNAQPFDYSKLIDHNKELNLRYYERFIPYLKKYGVMICIENLFSYDILMQRHAKSVCGDADETNFYIDQLGEEYFGACYDSGHLNHFGGDEGEYIRKLGKRLKCVHLHDSWGKDFHGMDWHLMPGQGDVDWYKIADAMKEVGYEGVANFELAAPRDKRWFDPYITYVGTMGNLIFNK